MSRSDAVSVLDDLLHVSCRESFFLLKSENLNFVVLVFQDLDLLPVVEQINTFSTVDFEETHEELYALLLGKFEDVVDGVLGDRADREGLAGTSLPVCKASYDASFE